MEWIPLTSEEQLNDISEQSFDHPVAIFKHSTRCGISAMAKNRMDTRWTYDKSVLPVYYLDLLQYRSISNRIAADFGVQHESPQLLLIHKGKCVFNTSHSGVSAEALKQALDGVNK
jgi:bacillithiol system protein YtxJ